MESKDEFEFRPINEGLGFHKKTADLKAEIKKTGIVEDRVARRIPGQSPSRPASSTEGRQSFQSPDREKSAIAPEPFRSAMDPSIQFYEKKDRDVFDRPSLASQIPLKSKSNFPVSEGSKSQPHESSTESNLFGKRSRGKLKRQAAPELNQETGQRLVATAPAIYPMLLDLFVTIGLASIFAVPLLMITEVNVALLFSGLLSDVTTQFSVGLLFVAVLSFYLIIARSFFYATLGEWAFDMSLGSLQDRESAFFPLRILARTMILLVTGIAALPLIGLIFQEDFLGQFTGTEIRKSEPNWEE